MTKPKMKEKTVRVQKKVWGSKQVLASPFAPIFPAPNPGTRDKVIEVLVTAFPKPFARRISRPARKKRVVGDIEVSDRTKQSDNSDAEMREEEKIPKGSVKRLRQKPEGLVCGVNEVTRALEKDKLELVVVCRDIVPSIMISHIPGLCFINSAKLVVLPGNGTDIGTILGTKRLIGFGIRRRGKDDGDDSRNEVVRSLLNGLSPLATPLDYPWLKASRGGEVPAFPEPQMIPHRSKKDIL